MVSKKIIVAICAILCTLLATYTMASGKIQVIISSSIPDVYENVDLSSELTNAFSTDLPDNVLRIVHLIDLRKESYSRKVNKFVSDPQGTYIYYWGDYYYTSGRTKYSYSFKEERYVPDPYGSYIYVPEFSWARSEKEKYIISSLYRRYENIESGTNYYLSVYVTDVDLENLFVKSVIPITLVGNDLKGTISQAKTQHYKITNKKTPYKIDVAVFFNPSIDQNTRMMCISKLQEDTRYNIYDRQYLNDVFKTIKFNDLFGQGVSLKFTPPRYIIAFDNPVSKTEITQSTRYLFFTNVMNGAYILKVISGGISVPVRVEVGSYYSYDFEKKSYVLNMKDGGYVKYYGGAWEKNTYTYTSTFYDYMLFEETDMNKYLSLLCNIYDTESGEIVGSKMFEYVRKIPKKEIVDRFGTERVNSETEANLSMASTLSNDVYDFLQTVFPLTSVVDKVQGTRVSLLSGENIGIKKGYVFQDIFDGYTMGYLRIDKVAADTSDGSVFYIIPGEQIKESTYALETKRYPTFAGVRLVVSASNDGLNFLIGYINKDIYYNQKGTLSIGYSITDLSALTPTNQFFAESSFFVLSKQMEIYFDLGMLSNDNFETTNAFLSPGIRISSYTDNSIYYPGGFGIFAQLEGKITYFDATLNITPILSLGMETRF